MKHHEIEGYFNHDKKTYYLWIEMQYDHGGIVDIIEIRKYDSPFSDNYRVMPVRFCDKFLSEHYAFLYASCVEKNGLPF